MALPSGGGNLRVLSWVPCLQEFACGLLGSVPAVAHLFTGLRACSSPLANYTPRRSLHVLSILYDRNNIYARKRDGATVLQ